MGGALSPPTLLWETQMNLDYLPEAKEGHMIPSEETLEFWKSIRLDTQYNNLFEIGLNAGHSAAINLELFPDVKVTSLDINRYRYTQVAADVLTEKFGERFSYIFCHSHAYHMRVRDGIYEKPNCDIVFIDGGHTASSVVNDVALSKFLGVTDVLIDDTNSSEVGSTTINLERLGVITKIKDYKYNNWSKSSRTNGQVTHYKFT